MKGCRIASNMPNPCFPLWPLGGAICRRPRTRRQEKGRYYDWSGLGVERRARRPSQATVICVMALPSGTQVQKMIASAPPVQIIGYHLLTLEHTSRLDLCLGVSPRASSVN